MLLDGSRVIFEVAALPSGRDHIAYADAGVIECLERESADQTLSLYQDKEGRAVCGHELTQFFAIQERMLHEGVRHVIDDQGPEIRQQHGWDFDDLHVFQIPRQRAAYGSRHSPQAALSESW